jgi:hypothetical protein
VGGILASLSLVSLASLVSQVVSLGRLGLVAATEEDERQKPRRGKGEPRERQLAHEETKRVQVLQVAPVGERVAARQHPFVPLEAPALRQRHNDVPICMIDCLTTPMMMKKMKMKKMMMMLPIMMI